jgi:hypothetical protein
VFTRGSVYPVRSRSDKTLMPAWIDVRFNCIRVMVPDGPCLYSHTYEASIALATRGSLSSVHEGRKGGKGNEDTIDCE